MANSGTLFLRISGLLTIDGMTIRVDHRHHTHEPEPYKSSEVANVHISFAICCSVVAALVAAAAVDAAHMTLKSGSASGSIKCTMACTMRKDSNPVKVVSMGGSRVWRKQKKIFTHFSKNSKSSTWTRHKSIGVLPKKEAKTSYFDWVFCSFLTFMLLAIWSKSEFAVCLS